MSEERYVHSLLSQLESSWEKERLHFPSAPPLKELWGVTMEERSRRGVAKHISLSEMMSIAYEVASDCFRAVQDGETMDFDSYYRTALANRVLKRLGHTARDRRRRRLLKEYSYDQRDRQFVYQNPLHTWISEAVSDLPPDDRWLIRQRYWVDRKISDIARATGKNHSTVSRELNRILAALKALFIEQCWELATESTQMAA